MLADDKRMAALELLRAYATEIRTEIERETRELSRELERVERSIAELSGVEKGRSGTPAFTKPVGEYAGLGPQRAVEKFLRGHPGRTFRPSETAKWLRAHGFSVTNPKLLGTQVRVALGRAKGKGLAEAAEIDGKLAFRALQPSVRHNEEGT